MAKRGAEEQLTKDAEGSGSEDDERVRTEALAPVEGRPIRGIPKRKGMNPSTFAPNPAAPTFSFGQGSSASSTAPSFSMGSTGASAAPTSSFSFGSTPTATPAAAPSPFSGFSFGKAASASAPSSATSFGSSTSAPAAPAAPAAEAPKTAPSPFSGFSFSKPAAAAAAPPPSATPVTAPAASKPPAASPFGGFSFSAGSSNGGKSSAPAPSPAFGFSAQTSTSNGSTSISETAKETTISEPAKPSEPTPSLMTPPPEKDVTYYTELRGLNASLLSFLTSSLAKDQFLDLTVVLPSLLKQYTSNLDASAKKAGRPVESREKVQSNGAAKSAGPPIASATPAPPAVASFPLLKAPSSSVPPASGGFTPTISAGSASSPFSFGGFGAKPATTTASIPSASTDSTPKKSAESTSSPFSFGGIGAKSASSSEPKKPSAEMNKLVEDLAEGKEEPKTTQAPTPFSFSAPAPKPTEGSNDSPSQPPALFSFSPSGPLHPTTPASKTFVPSSTTVAPTPPPPSKLGKFGPGGSTPQLSFGGAKNTPPSASGSGSGSSFSFGFGGASPAKPASTPFSFGSTPGASSGFSFGSGSKPAETSSASSKPAPFTGFSGFGSTSTPAAAPAAPTEESTSSAAETSELPPSDTKDLAQTAGAGEEDEETILECRGKLYRLEGGDHKVAGLGPFKVKKNKDSKRRLLMRADGSGNILLNMNLSTSFKVNADKKTVKFVGFNSEGKPTPYTMMVKTPELAIEIVSAIDKEIEALESETS